MYFHDILRMSDRPTDQVNHILDAQLMGKEKYVFPLTVRRRDILNYRVASLPKGNREFPFICRN